MRFYCISPRTRWRGHSKPDRRCCRSIRAARVSRVKKKWAGGKTHLFRRLETLFCRVHGGCRMLEVDDWFCWRLGTSGDGEGHEFSAEHRIPETGESAQISLSYFESIIEACCCYRTADNVSACCCYRTTDNVSACFCRILSPHLTLASSHNAIRVNVEYEGRDKNSYSGQDRVTPSTLSSVRRELTIPVPKLDSKSDPSRGGTWQLCCAGKLLRPRPTQHKW
jgi:hypothetical protein